MYKFSVSICSTADGHADYDCPVLQCLVLSLLVNLRKASVNAQCSIRKRRKGLFAEGSSRMSGCSKTLSTVLLASTLV